MSCEGCVEREASVSLVAHEAAMARQERTIKRLWILLIVMLALLVGTNALWIVRETQYEDVMITAEQQADGGNNYAIGGDYVGNETESDH